MRFKHRFTYIILKKWVWGVASSGVRAAAPHSVPALMPGVYPKRLYARMHKDSHTKPLHDATAQMAVDAQMQRHKQLTLQRCKTNIASNAKHPFSKNI